MPSAYAASDLVKLTWLGSDPDQVDELKNRWGRICDNSDTVFLGREITRSENVSEETARKIDVEIHRIISEQYTRATQIITEHRGALDKIAEALLEHETIEGKHVIEIIQFGELRSPVISAIVVKAEEKTSERKIADKPAVSDVVSPGGSTAPTPA
jgi:cell division protease FtsH